MIAAGIVTYEPDLDRLASNLKGIVGQVDFAVIFDNGSSNIRAIQAVASQAGPVDIVSNANNVGIATALNELARVAIERGADRLVTLDQDSVSPAGMVSTLSAAMGEGVAIATPYIVDRNKLTVDDYQALNLPPTERYSQPARRGAITSGSLISLRAWAEVGGFDDSFFIDYVDYDYNQRIMAAGYMIMRANRTYLLHEVGRATRTWLRVPRRDLDRRWHLETFYSFGHSPQRCYYKARNRVLFTRKHGRQLGMTHEGVWQIPQQIALTILFEDRRVEKLRAFLSGIRDGLRMPLGKGVA